MARGKSNKFAGAESRACSIKLMTARSAFAEQVVATHNY
jgi:hypothetical protein